MKWALAAVADLATSHFKVLTGERVTNTTVFDVLTLESIQNYPGNPRGAIGVPQQRYIICNW
jgi:hypothetical protein